MRNIYIIEDLIKNKSIEVLIYGKDCDSDINKLGNIELKKVTCEDKNSNKELFEFYTAEVYTRYSKENFDYHALILGLRKVAEVFKGKSIGLPMSVTLGPTFYIWDEIKEIFLNCKLTIIDDLS